MPSLTSSTGIACEAIATNRARKTSILSVVPVPLPAGERKSVDQRCPSRELALLGQHTHVGVTSSGRGSVDVHGTAAPLRSTSTPDL